MTDTKTTFWYLSHRCLCVTDLNKFYGLIGGVSDKCIVVKKVITSFLKKIREIRYECFCCIIA